MRWLLLATVTGCHVGAGPVIAVSRGGLRLGVEASGGLGPIATTVGSTTSVTSDEPTRVYFTVDPGVMVEVDHNNSGYDTFLAFGGTVGYSTNDGEGGNLAAGGWAAPVVLEDDKCRDVKWATSFAVGVRYLGGITEFFVAPKINSLAIPCL